MYYKRIRNTAFYWTLCALFLTLMVLSKFAVEIMGEIFLFCCIAKIPTDCKSSDSRLISTNFVQQLEENTFELPIQYAVIGPFYANFPLRYE